jgi:hypothetical protein
MTSPPDFSGYPGVFARGEHLANTFSVMRGLDESVSQPRAPGDRPVRANGIKMIDTRKGCLFDGHIALF